MERDFTGTDSIPVYVMLPLGIINMECELVDPEGLKQQLTTLKKSANIDGVMMDCWWGVTERNTPKEYNWSAYRTLFQMVRELNLKLQVVMSFHACGGNVGDDDVDIPLPQWITNIGNENPDIYFTDREGRRNKECLTWGVDDERVLGHRTASEVYFDYMKSFREEFDSFFEDRTISEIEIGLGPCGELRYPSYPKNHGWEYPGIGEFQCYDKYLARGLKIASETMGYASPWCEAPQDAGVYNSRPYETPFFSETGGYDSFYGRFFLNWYSNNLIKHGNIILVGAKTIFKDTPIAAKISGIHWWYDTASHAAELTAGFYNRYGQDGYTPIAHMLRQNGAALNFTCVELRTSQQYEEFPDALANPERLVWQVFNAAWDVGIAVAAENALPCYDRGKYNKILDNAKPAHNPAGKSLSAFTYLRLSSVLLEDDNLMEFAHFVRRMHGEDSFH